MLNHQDAGPGASSADGSNVPLQIHRLSAVCEVCGKPSQDLICPACMDRIRAEAIARKMREDKRLE